MCIKYVLIHITTSYFLSYFSTCRHTVNKQHLNIVIAYIACEEHTIAHFTAKLCRLKVCYNNNLFAD